MSFVARMVAASRERRVLDLGDAVVDADDIRAAALAAGDADPYGLRLSRARVAGSLDLRAFEVGVPLRFRSCRFAGPLNVEGASLHELVVTDGELPGLYARGVRIAHDLTLSDTVIRADRTANLPGAAIWMTEAEIGGRLFAAGTRLVGLTGRAMLCDRSRIAGDVRLAHGFRAEGEVRLLAVRITGSLDLTSAEFVPDDGRALDLSEMAVGGSVFLLDSRCVHGRCRVRGRIEMSHATVQGQILIRNADLAAPATGDGAQLYKATEPSGRRPFLRAPGLRVEGPLSIEGDTVVHGGLLLRGAELRGGVQIRGAVLNRGDMAVDLSQAAVGGISASQAAIEGSVSLANARVDGSVRLEGATLAHPAIRRGLHAVNVQVTGDVRLSGLSVLGGSVNFRGATISGVFTADGAFVTNPGDKTIALRRARIGGDLRLSGGFWSIGLMVFNRAVIDGRLRADDATFTWRPAESPLDPPGEANLLGCAVEGISAEVKGGMRLGWTLHGALDLSGATTAFIEDRPDQDWPADSHLGGLAYSRFNNGWDAPTRTAWLSRLGRYDPRAWEQLAAVLRTAGDRDGAEQVLIAQRRHARRIGAVPPRRRLFDLLQDVTVRYGFRPQRAVYLLLALVVAVTVTLSLPAARSGMRATDQNAAVFTPAGPVAAADPARCGNGRVRCLKPFFYAVDTVVPLIDLHQRSTWYPTSEHGGTWLEWWLNLCTILGWATSTVFALSLTRLARAA